MHCMLTVNRAKEDNASATENTEVSLPYGHIGVEEEHPNGNWHSCHAQTKTSTALFN